MLYSLKSRLPHWGPVADQIAAERAVPDAPSDEEMEAMFRLWKSRQAGRPDPMIVDNLLSQYGDTDQQIDALVTALGRAMG